MLARPRSMAMPGLTALLLLGSAVEASAQVFVSPRRAGQSSVRYDTQRWKTADLLEGETIGGAEAGGVRLFFYERERGSAERAAAWIEEAYRELSDFFGHTPRTRFPYVLYGSYQEFLRTNLFPVGEGVLGVTSPRSLEVALPYFGDHTAFQHVSKHELAHEFTIQKLRHVASEADVVGEPLAYFPLWFIEGLAEYAVFRELDGERAMIVRDLVTNPDLYLGHGLLRFWDDYPPYVLWTYQGGLARITFLEETYGEGTVMRILDTAPAMPARTGPSSRISSLQDLVEHLTGDDPETVAEKFDTWIKRRAFDDWLDSEHTVADVDLFYEVVGFPNALDASPDGDLIAYRSLSPDTGRTQLLVADPRAPQNTKRIAIDHRPGSESLHPTDPRNFDLGDGQILYVTESRGRDVLVRRQLKHVVKERDPRDVDEDEGPDLGLGEVEGEPRVRARIRKKRRERLRLRSHDIMAVGSVALSPDGDDAVFVGMDTGSVRHLYLWTDAGVRKLSDDLYSERDVTWGPAGIVYASDATDDGRYHLFHLPDPDAVPVQLTTGASMDRSPSWVGDDRVAYSRIVDGRAEVAVLELGTDEAVTTDLATGAFDPAPGPDDEVWALLHHGGRKRPARLDEGVFTEAPSLAEAFSAGSPQVLPSRSLDDASRYQPLAPNNWGLDGAFGLFGYSFGGLYGSLYLSASDQLRDHGLILQLSSFGSLELTNAQLLYLNQQGRLTLGGGPFHVWRYRLDQTVPGLTLLTGERFYGGTVSARLPLDRFVYVQLDQALGGAVSFLFPGDELVLGDEVGAWEDTNASTRFTSETTARIGIDTTEFHPKTGPVAGSSLLAEVTGGWLPLREQTYAQTRVDAAQYFALPLVSGANLGFEGSAGTSGGGDFQRSFWLLSYDTLRAYPLFAPELAGRHFWVTSAELQIPLDAIIRLAIASSVEGVAALDFGAVADDYPGLWDNRVLDGVLGTNFVLGPFELRLHFARAIDIGAPLPATPSPWVTNVSLAWLGGGLFGF